MKTAPNRILLAFKAWEDRKKEMEPLLKAGAADERTLRQMQLDHLRQARHRLKKVVRPDEIPFLPLLNNQVVKLERQQHPNLLIRLFFRLKDQWIDGPAYRKRQEQQRARNMLALNKQLDATGFGYLSGKLENHLSADLQKVEVPLEIKVNDQKALKYGLQFEKDPYGNFQLDRIACSIYKDGHLARANVIEMNEWPGVKANQLYHLLEGRAVRQTYQDALGRETSNWVAFGEDGLQQVDASNNFDVKTLLQAMPAITMNKEDLVQYLEQGQIVNARWKQEKNYQDISIEADPASRTLKLLDGSSQPVTAKQLNERAKEHAAKQKPEQPAQQVYRRQRRGQQI